MSDSPFKTESKINQQESEVEKTLSNSMEKLVELLSNITEFSTRELKSISIMQEDKRLRKHLEYYVLNKRHLKRKHANEILKALKTIAVSLGSSHGMSNIKIEEDKPKWKFWK